MPSSGLPGATLSATPTPPPANGRRWRRTIGRRGEASSSRSAGDTSHSASAAAASRTMTASGFSSRCLRRRSFATAPSSRPSQTRWYPPSPFMAPIRPARTSRANAFSGSHPSTWLPAASSSASRGPHAGQAIGWAWNRRSDGSSYSARQAGHIANNAMVVRWRSYGAPVTIVSRGPQSVQLRNGYRNRRSRGSNNSARRRSHVAASAAMTADPASPAGPASLRSMRNRRSPRGGRRSHVQSSIRASGGGSATSRATSVSSDRASPSTSIRTPPESFLTNPASPRPDARL